MIAQPNAIPGDLQLLMEEFLQHKRARGASRNTLLAYRADLSLLIVFLARYGVSLVQLASERLVNRWLDDGLIHFKWNRRSAARRLSTARSFFDWCRSEALIDHNPAALVRVRFRPRTVVAPEMDALKRVVAAVGTHEPVDIRDRAILMLLLDAALRAGEVEALNAPGQGAQTFTVDLVGRRVFARPKGLPDDEIDSDVVGIEEQTADALKAWLRVRKANARLDDPALFVNHHGRRMSRQSIYQMVRARGRAAGVEGLHPHMFRHRRVAEVVEKLGVKVGQAQARHRQASTTLNVYGAHAGEVVREAIRRNVPVGEVRA